MDVLFVCTANICRSPMAEGLLRHRLEGLGVPAHVHSCGLLESGRPVTREGVEVMAALGIDTSAHVSTNLDRSLVAAADVVVGMTREHVREAVLACPEAWPRSFTLKEVVRRGEQAGWRRPGESFSQWLDRVGENRSRSDLLGMSRADDIADPMGLGLAQYEQTRDELVDLIDRFVALAFSMADQR